MSWFVLLGVAVGLAMDAFAAAVAVSVSLRSVSRHQVLRLAWHFGLFQALMPIVGWLAGVSVVAWIAWWDHWFAFALLAFVGLRAIRSGMRGGEPGSSAPDPTRGASLVVLSLATSLDALAAGLSFAALGVRVWVAEPGDRLHGRSAHGDRDDLRQPARAQLRRLGRGGRRRGADRDRAPDRARTHVGACRA